MRLNKIFYFILVSVFLPHLSHSVGENSGGGARSEKRARRAFRSMTAVEAYESDLFSKKVSKIKLPTYNRSIDAQNLCRTSDTVKTINPINGASPSSPIHYSAEVKIWGATKGHFDELVTENLGVPKKFRSRHDASKEGRPVVIEVKSVAQTIPTSYSIEFFSISHSGNRYEHDKFVGSHRYQMARCR